MVFIVGYEDDWSMLESPMQRIDNFLNLHIKTHQKRRHTSSTCGDNHSNSPVILQTKHEFDHLENRSAGEIFDILSWSHYSIALTHR